MANVGTIESAPEDEVRITIADAIGIAEGSSGEYKANNLITAQAVLEAIYAAGYRIIVQ